MDINSQNNEHDEFSDLISLATTATDHPGMPDHGMVDAPEIVSPIDGRCADPTNADELIDLLEHLNGIDSKLYAAKIAIRKALAKLTEGDAKTRRVQGQRRKAKVEMPDDKWDQGILKEAYNSFPKFRDQILRIGTINVQLREYKKAVNTAGPDDWNTFRDMVTKANQGPSDTPTVKIEV